MIITDNGIVIRLKIEDISKMSRVTQGVKLIHLKEDEVSSIAILDNYVEEEENENVSRETSENDK